MKFEIEIYFKSKNDVFKIDTGLDSLIKNSDNITIDDLKELVYSSLQSIEKSFTTYDDSKYIIISTLYEKYYIDYNDILMVIFPNISEIFEYIEIQNII